MINNNTFPDGTLIDSWFLNAEIPKLENLGKQYVLTDYGILPDGKIHTEEIQNLIDTANKNGGGVIVVPKGTFLTGALFFKQNVNLYLCDGAVLMGSDNIADYPVLDTRIEGESCKYFSALINADSLDGFTICGKGVIDGNGHRAWKAFWIRIEWNPACTNKDEQRPRLVFISNCSNVTVAEVSLINSHFWTNHIYKSHHVKYLGCHIFAPHTPVGAPSSDAVDIDVCTDVHIKNCYFDINDDSVVLKGGKGPYADTLEENGANERILVEDCTYGYCHGCLTCGSESIHNKNVIVRNVTVKEAHNFLWFKMRPDTPQKYEFIRIENAKGKVNSFIHVHPWTQFFDLKGRKDIPLSVAENISLENCDFECDIFFDAEKCDQQYILSDFSLKDINIKAHYCSISDDLIRNLTVENLNTTEI